MRYSIKLTKIKPMNPPTAPIAIGILEVPDDGVGDGGGEFELGFDGVFCMGGDDCGGLNRLDGLSVSGPLGLIGVCGDWEIPRLSDEGAERILSGDCVPPDCIEGLLELSMC